MSIIPLRRPGRPARQADDGGLDPEEDQVPLLEEAASFPPPGGRPDDLVQIQMGGEGPLHL